MGFFKRKGKILLTVCFSIFIILQQIAVQYRRAYSSKMEMIDAKGYDTVALHQINQLEEIWRKANLEDLVTPAMIASPKQLELARTRLKLAEKSIHESEKRVQGVGGENQEFFKKAYAYYNHSASALVEIVDFLLATKEEYSVKENEIFFERESNATRFRELIGTLSSLYREKEDLDTFILHHNREVENKLIAR